MTLHILELIQASLQEVEKRCEKITEPDDLIITKRSESKQGNRPCVFEQTESFSARQ